MSERIESLKTEIQQEASQTIKALERLPEDQFGWKPHPKSYSLGALATHISRLVSWFGITLTSDELDLAQSGIRGAVLDSVTSIREELEKNVQKAIEALESIEDSELDKLWRLRMGDRVFFEMPKKVVLRKMVLSHLVHHRGQLTVYMRLLDIPVPGMYGPSADEQ